MQQLPGDEAPPAVVDGCLVGLASLPLELGAGTSGPAEGTHGPGGEERGFDVVSYGIGDGELHGVAIDAPVEGAATDVRRRFQCSGDREPGRLTCRREADGQPVGPAGPGGRASGHRRGRTWRTRYSAAPAGTVTAGTVTTAICRSAVSRSAAVSPPSRW